MWKSVSKPGATQLVFATQEIIFNGKEVPNVLNTSDVTETGATITKKPKTSAKKNTKQKNQNDNRGCNNFNQNSSRNKDFSNCSRF